MIHTTRKPVRGNFPTLASLLHDVVNAPVKDVVKEQVRYTYPAVNVKEYEDHFLLQMTVPGYAREDINIHVEDYILTISSEKDLAEPERNYTLREFHYGHFSRKFTLPKEVVADKIEASFSHGILTLFIPKAEEVKPRKIIIK